MTRQALKAKSFGLKLVETVIHGFDFKLSDTKLSDSDVYESFENAYNLDLESFNNPKNLYTIVDTSLAKFLAKKGDEKKIP